jgi:hypothetical protein
MSEQTNQNTENVNNDESTTVTEPVELTNVNNTQNVNATQLESIKEQVSSEVCIEESNTINAKPVFEVDEDDEDDEEDKKPDLSNYTVIDGDNLDEDTVLPKQKFCLFSFMSPEGIMNCNVRAFKFRGAYETEKEAKEAVKELKKKDKYFNVFVGEQGKWLEFDPPEDHVDKVVAGNSKRQKIVDSQRETRMNQINELAGKHKDKLNKTDRGSKSRIEESKKVSASEDYANKKREKTKAKKEAQKEKHVTATHKPSRAEAMKNRLRKRLAEKKEKETNKKRLEDIKNEPLNRFESGQVDDTSNSSEQLKKNTKIVHEATANLVKKKSELEKTNANIDKIRKMMQK